MTKIFPSRRRRWSRAMRNFFALHSLTPVSIYRQPYATLLNGRGGYDICRMKETTGVVIATINIYDRDCDNIADITAALKEDNG